MDESKPQGFLDDDFDDAGNYLNEKESHGAGLQEKSPGSPDSSLGADISPLSPAVPPKGYQYRGFVPNGIDETLGSAQPLPPEQRICGLRRKRFWELFGVSLALLVAAAVVGGVVGGLKARNHNSHTSPSTAPPTGNNSSANAFAPLL